MNQLTGTLNVGGNFYNSPPSAVPGAKAFRDAQVGTEVDWAFCTSSSSPVLSLFGNSTLGFVYYYSGPGEPFDSQGFIGWNAAIRHQHHRLIVDGNASFCKERAHQLRSGEIRHWHGQECKVPHSDKLLQSH
jgi:hypothetical protein